jgi:hypothetical protein
VHKNGCQNNVAPMLQSTPVAELVMQCCDKTSLFRLARCSTTLLRRAQHPLAWKKQIRIRVWSPDLEHEPRRARGLIRMAKLDVTAMDSRLTTLLTLTSQIHTIRSDDYAISKAMVVVFQQRNVRSMHLRFDSPLLLPSDTEEQQTWTFPPSVCSLTLSGTFDPHIARKTMSLRHLTHLDISNTCYRSDTMEAIMHAIMDCSHLRHLEMYISQDAYRAVWNVLESHSKLVHLHTFIMHGEDSEWRDRAMLGACMTRPALRTFGYRQPSQDDSVDCMMRQLCVLGSAGSAVTTFVLGTHLRGPPSSETMRRLLATWPQCTIWLEPARAMSIPFISGYQHAKLAEKHYVQATALAALDRARVFYDEWIPKDISPTLT